MWTPTQSGFGLTKYCRTRRNLPFGLGIIVALLFAHNMSRLNGCGFLILALVLAGKIVGFNSCIDFASQKFVRKPSPEKRLGTRVHVGVAPIISQPIIWFRVSQ